MVVYCNCVYGRLERVCKVQGQYNTKTHYEKCLSTYMWKIIQNINWVRVDNHCKNKIIETYLQNVLVFILWPEL